MSDVESDLPPELDVDLNNILDNVVSETNLVNPETSANNGDGDDEDKPISTLVEDEDEQEKPVENDSKVENVET